MHYRYMAVSALLLAVPAFGQTTVNPQRVVEPQSVSVTIPLQNVTGDILRSGAPVPVVLMQHLTTKGKALKVGQPVQLEVAQDIMLNGRVVIPARSPVEGVITHVRNKGMWGKSGAIRLAVTSVNINGTKVRLKGEMDDRGETGTAGVVGAIVALPVAGFFVTGTSAEMPLHMPGRAFLDEDIALASAR